MATCISKKPTAKEPVSIGTIILKRIEALAFWVKNRLICVEPLTSADFTRDTLDEVQANMMATESQKDAEEEIASKSEPGELQSDNLKWVNWKKRLVNHLNNIQCTCRVRLIYIIQELVLKPLALDHQFVNKGDRMIWCAVHAEPEYQIDNTNVYQIIEWCCIGTNRATWIHQDSNSKNSFSAVSSLCQQLDGRNMKQKHKMDAKQQLWILHYRNKKALMKFDKFAEY